MLREIFGTSSFLAFFIVSSMCYADNRLPIQDFVRNIYVTGVPYNVAKTYGPEETKLLFDMLNDTNEERYWPNIIVTIEIIGDESDVDRVISFINESATGEFSASRYQAKRSAIFGLGFMINNLKSERALRYLEEKLDPASWSNMEGTSNRFASITERNHDLSKYALLGLSLAGTDEAIDAINSFKSSELIRSGFGIKVKDLVDNAILESEKIRKKGMSDYQSHSH
jgi:hypothetical protein